MTPQEEEVLIAAAQLGDKKAKARIISSVVRLIRRDAVRWSRGRTDDVEDLVQDGIMATLHAIDKFEVSRGWRFSTYANWWWRQAIIAQSQRYWSRGWGGVGSVLRSRYYPLRGHMDAALESNDPVGYLVNKTGFARDVVEGFLMMHTPMSSLYAVDQDGDTLSDGGIDPEVGAYKAELNEAVQRTVAQLPQGTREIIQWRYLNREHSYQHISNCLGISRQAVQQREARAMRKMVAKLKRFQDEEA